MDVISGISFLLATWSIIYLLDHHFKGHRKYALRYLSFMTQRGITTSPFQVRWFTTSLNRLFVRIGQSNSRFFCIWFNFGVVFGFIALIVSVGLLLWLVVNHFTPDAPQQQVLTPVLPGVNLPSNQLGYYLLTLLICGILHEVGHAVAAVGENVRVNGCGLFLLAIYPGAYVDLCTDHVLACKPIQQLRIFCAGVWHNFVLVLLAIIVVFSIPTLSAPFYKINAGVVVTDLPEGSPAVGRHGLVPGDVLTSIVACPVYNGADWKSCFTSALQEESPGFCVTKDFIHLHNNSSPVDCCLNVTDTHLCFNFTKVSLPIFSTQAKYNVCLPVRATTSNAYCYDNKDCNLEQSLCVRPVLADEMKLLIVHRQHKKPLLFEGHPLDLYYTVYISDFVPRYLFIPRKLPEIFILLCKYFISLSGALAILNIVPCYALDGQWIIQAFIELWLADIIKSKATRNNISRVFLCFGSFLLALNIIIAMSSLVR